MIGLDIFTRIILPIFILIGLGVVVDHFIEIDVRTLARITFTLFMPAMIFVNLVESQLDAGSFGSILAFLLVHFILMLVLGYALFSAKRFRQQRMLLIMGSVFMNSGNFGTPLAAMAFGDLGVSVMALVMVIQSVTLFTLGVWMVNPAARSWRGALRDLVTVPVIYAVLAAFAVRLLHITVPEIIWQPLHYLSAAVVPAALLTLGIQLGRSRLSRSMLPSLSAVTIVRLVLSPLLAVGLLIAWRTFFPGSLDNTAQILIIAAGLPAAINITVLAIEYDQKPHESSQMVFITTLLSAITLTIWLTITGSGLV